MKALWKFVAINRRTDQKMVDEFIASADPAEALSNILLNHGDDIKQAVGDPDECLFDVLLVKAYIPIEGSDNE